MTYLLGDPGFYDIDADDYHKDPCEAGPSLSNSIGQVLIERCARAAWWAHPRLNPQFVEDADTKFDRGTVAHALLLGKGRAFRPIDAADYRSKAAQMSRDAYREAGLTPILVGHLATAQAMEREARRQLTDVDGGEFAFNPQFGEIELCGLSRDPVGCWGRTLIDFYGSKIPSGVTCWDYKTTSGSANPQMLRPMFNRLGWAFQAAFQERVIVTLKPALAGKIRFRFFVQENEEPYLCSVIEPSGEAMTIAHKMVAAAYAIWKACLERNQWPGYPKDSTPIGVLAGVEAAWLTRELEDEMVMLANNDPFLGGAVTPLSTMERVAADLRAGAFRGESVALNAVKAADENAGVKARKKRGPYGPRKLKEPAITKAEAQADAAARDALPKPGMPAPRQIAGIDVPNPALDRQFDEQQEDARPKTTLMDGG